MASIFKALCGRNTAWLSAGRALGAAVLRSPRSKKAAKLKNLAAFKIRK